MFTANVTVRIRQSFIWVRTADGAGNVSDWQKIALPAKR
jgi:hypothetical protein